MLLLSTGPCEDSRWAEFELATLNRPGLKAQRQLRQIKGKPGAPVTIASKKKKNLCAFVISATMPFCFYLRSLGAPFSIAHPSTRTF